MQAATSGGAVQGGCLGGGDPYPGAAVIVPNNTVGFCSRVFTIPKPERGVEYGKRFIIILKVSFILNNDTQSLFRFYPDLYQLRVIEFLHICMPTLNPVGDTTGYTSLIVQPLVYLISHCSVSEQAVRPEDTLHHDRRVPGALRYPTGGLGGQAGPGERYAHNI
jgi:hypothetical protein